MFLQLSYFQTQDVIILKWCDDRLLTVDCRQCVTVLIPHIGRVYFGFFCETAGQAVDTNFLCVPGAGADLQVAQWLRSSLPINQTKIVVLRLTLPTCRIYCSLEKYFNPHVSNQTHIIRMHSVWLPHLYLAFCTNEFRSVISDSRLAEALSSRWLISIPLKDHVSIKSLLA